MISNTEKDILINLCISILHKHNITNDIHTISKETCLLILNEIVECFKETTEVIHALIDISPDDKPSIIIELILDVLSSSKLEANLSNEVREEISNLTNNAEAMDIVLKFINYVNGELLKSLDNNGDGKITIEEVEQDVVDCLLCNKLGGCACYNSDECCNCCPDFSRKIGNIIGKIFIKIICCGCEKNYIEKKG